MSHHHIIRPMEFSWKITDGPWLVFMGIPIMTIPNHPKKNHPQSIFEEYSTVQ
jgi:hypothetical protein